MEEEMYSCDEIAARKLKLHLKDVLFEKGLSNIDAAGKLNINPERIHKYTNPKCANNNLPACLVPLWHKTIGPEVLDWIAAEAGAIVVPAPEAKTSIEDAVRAAATAMRECSEAFQTFLHSVADGEVTLRELKSIRREVQEALGALAGLVVMAEEIRRQ